MNKNPASSSKKAIKVYVAGDGHVEMALLRGKSGEGFSLYDIPGGAHMLSESLKIVADQKGNEFVVESGPSLDRTPTGPKVMVEFECFDAEIDENPDRKGWRIKDRFGWSRDGITNADPPALPLTEAPNLLVVYDRASGVYDPSVVEHITGKGNTITIIQVREAKNSTSWFHRLKSLAALDDGFFSRVIVIMEANCLRGGSSDPRPDISTLSLERAARDIADGLRPQGSLYRSMQMLQHVIVVLSADAMVYCRRTEKFWHTDLYYHFQGLYSHRDALEDRVGFTSIVTVSAAQKIAGELKEKHDASSTIAKGLKAGISLGIERCRRYRQLGLDNLEDAQVRRPISGREVLQHWCRGILAPDDRTDTRAIRSATIDAGPHWSLLRSCCKTISNSDPAGDGDSKSPFFAAASMIVNEGLKDAQNHYGFPVARFAKWTGVDHEEIEGYQTLRRLIKKYVADKGWMGPLSLASFGPPGSGKSFGIREIAAELRAQSRGAPTLAADALEFNLGGFTSVSDLCRALHKSRNASLKGEVPLVMFDEFDSTFDGRPHGWLKYLLAPTQDGRFRDGDIEYNVGRAIFIFVGGVSHTFDDLAGQMRSRSFIEAKGPDFVSRLRGHVNVRGPDPFGDNDELYVIRRATMLRSTLDRQGYESLRLDPDVVRAFLGVHEYRHGVRSIEAIVQMSDFSEPRNQFTKSSLPPPDQLDMHTDAMHFLEIAHKP